MVRRIFTGVLIALFLVSLTSLLFGEGGRLKGKVSNLKYRIATQQDEENLISKIHGLDATVVESVGDTAGQSWYDYACNSIIRPMAANSTNGTHVTFMRLGGPEPPFTRYVAYNYWDDASGIFFGDVDVVTDRRTGWGTVLNGSSDEAWVFHHGGGIAAQQDAGEGFYSFTQTIIGAGIFPSADMNGNTIVVTSDEDGDFVPDSVMYSTDYGATWNFADLPQTINDSLTISSTEAPIAIDPTTGDWVCAFALDAPSGAGFLALARTSDMGATWNVDLLYQEGTVINDATYFVDNFAQVNLAIGADGVVHVVFNGYGGHVTNNTIDYIIYPVVYWNSANQQFVEVTDPSIGRNPGLDGWLDPNFFGGLNGRNAVGCAYPSVAVSDDGWVWVVWQQNEFNGFPDSTTYVPARDDSMGGAPNPAWGATDIYGAISVDNGTNWQTPSKMAGSDEWIDQFASVDRHIEVDGSGNHFLNLMYNYDPVPGMSLFEYLPGMTSWIYAKVPGVVGIGDNDNNVADKFSLAQNYPNPFNPVTTISYTLAKSAKVKLEVYNVVGEKVATLVDGKVAAGEHEVLFDASNLSSGVYFYKLTSGDFSMTRKMMLLK